MIPSTPSMDGIQPGRIKKNFVTPGLMEVENGDGV
jgi:hypothetical protein